MVLTEIAQAQRERLFHIEFRAGFLGAISRSDIMHRFGVKEAAATRDLALYRSLAPTNLLYRGDRKIYVRGAAFRPLFDHDPLQTLTAIADGFGDDTIAAMGPYVPTERPLRLNQPDIAVIAAVSLAIAQQRLLTIRYRSLSSGVSERLVAPFALVDSGVRWHARAFDRHRDRFADFVLTRIEAATLSDEARADAEGWQEDDQWTRRVVLRLRPHPGLAHPEAVAMDYAMEDGEAAVRVRAAVAGYLLHHFDVDCSPDHRLSPARHHLWLANAAELVGVANLAIAPGYAPG